MALSTYTTRYTRNIKADVALEERVKLHMLYRVPMRLTRVIEDVTYVAEKSLPIHWELYSYGE